MSDIEVLWEDRPLLRNFMFLFEFLESFIGLRPDVPALGLDALLVLGGELPPGLASQSEHVLVLALVLHEELSHEENVGA